MILLSERREGKGREGRERKEKGRGREGRKEKTLLLSKRRGNRITR